MAPSAESATREHNQRNGDPMTLEDDRHQVGGGLFDLELLP
jgi:hypothetical protein